MVHIGDFILIYGCILYLCLGICGEYILKFNPSVEGLEDISSIKFQVFKRKLLIKIAEKTDVPFADRLNWNDRVYRENLVKVYYYLDFPNVKYYKDKSPKDVEEMLKGKTPEEAKKKVATFYKMVEVTESDHMKGLREKYLSVSEKLKLGCECDNEQHKKESALSYLYRHEEEPWLNPFFREDFKKFLDRISEGE